jgi:plasmid stability protein
MATITLKNIPEQLHKKIKQRAIEHHRSLNNEIISCLERALGSSPVDTEALIT